MDNISLTVNDLSALNWYQTIQLGKATILAILDELSLDYNERDNYFRLCSKVYQHFKHQKTEQLEAAHEETVEVVDFEHLSFRELQLQAIGKSEESTEPIETPEPEAPKQLRAIRTWSNKGSYYGMDVIRCLVLDPETRREWWVGSNAIDNIQEGDLVIQSTGLTGNTLGWVVPINRTASV